VAISFVQFLSQSVEHPTRSIYRNRDIPVTAKCIALLCTALALAWPALAGAATSCLVIAHRGASGYLPEHTLASYRLAIQLGADYIEPDLVLTRDGVPIARHESELSQTTDVAARPEFAGRRSTRALAGGELSGWFSEDFTLAEIRQLKARERLPDLRPNGAAYDGLWGVPTLQEIIDLVRAVEARTGRRIGLYPEVKSPGPFRARGLDPERAIVAVLAKNGYTRAADPVILQSFDTDSLRRLAELTDLRRVQLLWREPGQALPDDKQLRAIAAYAQGVGVDKHGFIIPLDARERLAPGSATDFVARAHAAGLFAHAYTFRAENHYLPANFRSDIPGKPRPAAPGDAAGEIRAFLAAGIDGFFTDQPDIGREACRGRD
jgi:glycerophosphoryl diester phosphodiesterase